LAQFKELPREISERLGIFFFEAQDSLGYNQVACLEDNDGLQFIIQKAYVSHVEESQIWAVAQNIDVKALVSHIAEVLEIDETQITWITDSSHEWEGLDT